MRKREKTLSVLFLLFLISKTSSAGYSVGHVWDFKNNFSTTQNRVLDSQGNIAWEYRGGTYTYKPSQAVLLPGYDGTVNGNKGAWAGATSPQSWIGPGFMRACWETTQPGTGDRYPFLIWKSNFTGSVNVDIQITDATHLYRANVFLNDYSDPAGEHSGSSGNFSYFKQISVNPGDLVALRLGSDYINQNPLANVGFTVTLQSIIPEPTVMGMMVFGLAGLVLRRRKKA